MGKTGERKAVARSIPGAAALAAGLLWASLALPALAAPTSARDRLAAATTVARAWQADAQLVRVETKNADAQGRSPDWTYVFDSPAAKQQRLVFVFGADKPDLLPTSTVFKRPLAGFVDSTRAMQEAVRQGLKTHGAGMSMSVTGGEPVQWRVLSGDHSFVIDAASGRFVTREKD